MTTFAARELQNTCKEYMARAKLYLDTRAAKDGKPAPLKVAINNKSKTALISLDIHLLPSQWDAKSCKEWC